MSNTVKERLQGEKTENFNGLLPIVKRWTKLIINDEPLPGCLELLYAEANGWDDVLCLGLKDKHSLL